MRLSDYATRRARLEYFRLKRRWLDDRVARARAAGAVCNLFSLGELS